MDASAMLSVLVSSTVRVAASLHKMLAAKLLLILNRGAFVAPESFPIPTRTSTPASASVAKGGEEPFCDGGLT